jgi:hypothetical protein
MYLINNAFFKYFIYIGAVAKLFYNYFLTFYIFKKNKNIK